MLRIILFFVFLGNFVSLAAMRIEFLGSRNFYVLKAFVADSEEPAATMLFSVEPNVEKTHSTGFVHDFEVIPHRQGCGIGSFLFATAALKMQELGAACIQLEAFTPPQELGGKLRLERLIHFYKRLGGVFDASVAVDSGRGFCFDLLSEMNQGRYRRLTRVGHEAVGLVGVSIKKITPEFLARVVTEDGLVQCSFEYQDGLYLYSVRRFTFSPSPRKVSRDDVRKFCETKRFCFSDL